VRCEPCIVVQIPQGKKEGHHHTCILDIRHVEKGDRAVSVTNVQKQPIGKWKPRRTIQGQCVGQPLRCVRILELQSKGQYFLWLVRMMKPLKNYRTT
jgi:hypothetical protein